MNDEKDDVTWITQQGPIDATLKTIALMAVNRLGGDVTFELAEYEQMRQVYGENAALHVVADDKQMHVVVTTRAEVVQNQFMEDRRAN